MFDVPIYKVPIRSAHKEGVIHPQLASSAGTEHQFRLGVELFSRKKRNIRLREFLRLDVGDTGCRKQMLVLEQLQHVQRTSDPVSAHEQRGRNV